MSLSHYIPHIVIAVVSIPVVHFLAKNLGKWIWKSTVGELQADRQRLANTDSNLEKVMTNHLPHIQASLNEMVSKQEQANILLAEQSGYLKGILEKK